MRTTDGTCNNAVLTLNHYETKELKDILFSEIYIHVNVNVNIHIFSVDRGENREKNGKLLPQIMRYVH